MRRPTRARRAFTLLEILVVMTVAAVIVVLVIPTTGNEDRMRLAAGAEILRSDIELAQAMTIADPNQPIIVKFDPATSTYWLAEEATPDTPIDREGALGDYTVTFGTGRADIAGPLAMALTDVTGNVLSFDAHGGVTDFTLSPEIKLSIGNTWIALDVSPETGMIDETFGVDTGGGGGGGGGGGFENFQEEGPEQSF